MENYKIDNDEEQIYNAEDRINNDEDRINNDEEQLYNNDEDDGVTKDEHNDDERGHTQKNADGKFSYQEIQEYLQQQKYPLGYTKADKLALRKRAKFFTVDDGILYYTGKG